MTFAHRLLRVQRALIALVVVIMADTGNYRTSEYPVHAENAAQYRTAAAYDVRSIVRRHPVGKVYVHGSACPG